MEKIIIEGKHKLEGEIKVQGSKNSVLPILAGTVLTKEKCTIHNCPNLKDVHSAIQILKHLGCHIVKEGTSVTVDARNIHRSDIPLELMGEMRSSVIFLGAILSRCKTTSMSFPGGCELGPRPVDMHIAGLRKLGAHINDQYGNLEGNTLGFKGATIQLSFPSVGATENIMLAAAVSEGTTVIGNSAREPEIEDLQGFLNKMGAKIKGAGSSTIVIEGVKELHGITYEVIPDRIVACTYLAAAAVTGGTIHLTEVIPQHLEGITELFVESGCKIIKEDSGITLYSPEVIKPIRTIQTMPYPGFPTDMQSILMAYLLLAQGTSVFVENIFESRYKQVGELMRMGADIKVLGKMAIVYGVDCLTGAKVQCTDLRGGAALVVAALAAQGITEIGEIDHIDRGYDDIVGCLGALGAKIKRI